LLTKIKKIQDDIKNVQPDKNWEQTNKKNKETLTSQLNALCEKKREREVELKQAQDLLKELNNPERRPPATPQEREELCKKLIHDLEGLTKEIDEINESIKRTRRAI